MGYSGTYRYINGKLIKVSEEIPSLTGVFDAAGWTGPYFSQALGQYIESREQKRALMKQHNCIEFDPSIAKKKESKAERLKKIKTRVAQHLNDRGVERIQLKDLK
jgi:hypothetical protein